MKNSLDRDEIARYIVDVMLKKEPTDETEFREWLETNEFAHDCVNEFSDKERLDEKFREFNQSEKMNNAKVLVKQLQCMQKRRRMVIRATGIVAVLILVSALLWYEKTEQDIVPSEALVNVITTVETPKLILADGNTVSLTEVQERMIAEGVSNGSGMIKVTPSATNVIAASRPNKLVVPSRCTYSITLSDGSKVTLNANSELIFPQSFGDVREVELKGEAYFDVAKDKKRPFIVKNNDINIEVLGTKFNVNGYDSNHVQTFLSSGRVSVTAANTKGVMLEPMQVANFTQGKFRVEKVTDENQFLAWLNNDFIFEALPIYTAFSVLERWYGVTFDRVFVSNRKILITAMFSREMELEEIVAAIEKIAGIEIYEMNGMYHIKELPM